MKEDKFFELVNSLATSAAAPSSGAIKERLVAGGAKAEDGLVSDTAALISAIRCFNAANWTSVGAKVDRWGRLTGATRLLFERYFVGGTSDADWQGFKLALA